VSERFKVSVLKTDMHTHSFHKPVYESFYFQIYLLDVVFYVVFYLQESTMSM
jgi:hypothetical protein